MEELVFREAVNVVRNAEGVATNLEITSTGRRIERLQRLHCDIRTGYLVRWAEEFWDESWIAGCAGGRSAYGGMEVDSEEIEG